MKQKSIPLQYPKPVLPSLASVILILLALAGCAGRPLKGGRALTAPKPGGGLQQSLSQGDNPSQPSTQTQENIQVRTFTVPAGSRFELSPLAADGDGRRGASERGALGTHHESRSAKGELPSAPSSSLHPLSSSCILSAPMPVTERQETRAATQLGAAQKDSAREVGARLASLRGIVWVGLGVFLFGLGSLFYPPLRALIGSVTSSLTITVGGIALMILPTLIVGNELLILGGVATGVGAWFLAHRHGQLRGLVESTSTTPSHPSTPEQP